MPSCWISERFLALLHQDLFCHLNQWFQELEALKSELEETQDQTATVLDMRTKREQEVVQLKKAIEDEVNSHEQQITELRHKQGQQIEQLNDQLDQSKKVDKLMYTVLISYID